MGAFKIRGACNMIAQLPPEARAAGVITYSSGNHGQAVALVAQRFGIPAVIVMPETAPRVKVDGVRQLRRRGDLRGHDVRRPQGARRGRSGRARPDDRAAVRSPWIIAGAGTVGLEISSSARTRRRSSCRWAAAG